MCECVRGMSYDEIITELTKDDLGKCNGCPKLSYKNGILGCEYTMGTQSFELESGDK